MRSTPMCSNHVRPSRGTDTVVVFAGTRLSGARTTAPSAASATDAPPKTTVSEYVPVSFGSNVVARTVRMSSPAERQLASCNRALNSPPLSSSAKASVVPA
jgi:hypothetical protein